MLDIKLIRENPELIKSNLVRRQKDPILVDQILQIDSERRELIVKTDELKSQRNKIGKKPSTEEIAVLQKNKKDLEVKEDQLKEFDKQYTDLMLKLPNLLDKEVPDGKDDSENVVLRKHGEPTQFDFLPKDHLQLGKQLDLLDFERGAKVAGSGFFYEKNELALLDLALQKYAMEKLRSKGFQIIITPDLAKDNILSGTGYMPRGPETQIYSIDKKDLGLIGTAEISIGGYHSDEILDMNQLPLKYVGFSHCFRTEDGSYGKYAKGLYRVHQFSKVEMFIFCLPEDSEKYHQEMLGIEEEIFQELKLPYRVLLQCAGDVGAPCIKTYDIEAWMPSREAYGEVTSTSNTTSFQARRLNIRYKNTDGKNDFVHMLNGTAMTNSRIPLAILENYQQADGSILIPEVLRKYTGFDRIG